MTSLRGLPRPTPGSCAIAGANRGENRLICKPRQATIRSDGRTIGECRYNGLLELHARDVFQLFRTAELTIADFRTPRAGYATIWGERDGVPLTIGDLRSIRVDNALDSPGGCSPSGPT